MSGDRLRCETCERDVARADAIRREPMADLDPTTWQALCCPECGRKLKTVLVRPEE
jgi:hypothetical protein